MHSSSVARLHGLVSRALRRRSVFLQPATSVVPVRLESSDNHNSPFYKWKGSSPSDHTVPRVKRGDETDPETEATAKGMKDKEEYYGIEEYDLPEGVTERGGTALNRNAKRQFPKAPEPIVGANDEIGRVCSSFFFFFFFCLNR